MIRVHIICEGQTEEMFINEVLFSHFLPQGICLVPSLIGRPGHKGGKVSFDRILIDIKARLLNDTCSFCSTFFDFYGLPSNFPGKQEASRKTTIEEKAQCISSCFEERLDAIIDNNSLRRFIPYVQMYEFEALLFSGPQKLAEAINQSSVVVDLEKIRKQFATPEDINNSSETAPSKRILKLYSGYEKPIHGSLAAIEVGLEVIRKECTLFNSWLTKLESLADS